MARGRKKTPDFMKVINGTDQPCRMTDKPTARQSLGTTEETESGETSKPLFERPTWMKGEARKVFEYLLPIIQDLGRAQPQDYYLFINYCELVGKQNEAFKKK